MNRREFFGFAGGAALAFPLTVRAEGRKIPTVGILWHAGSVEQEGAYYRAMLQGFADAGYIVGQTIKLEHRFPNEIPDNFKNMAAELVAAKVDVLVGVGAASSVAVKNATATIPIVFTIAPDPVTSKLVDSLARLGGNATGFTIVPVELSAKRLQLLKEMLPGFSHFGLLVNPTDKFAHGYVTEGEAAAAKLGLTQQTFEAPTSDQIEPAFDSIAQARVQAVVIGPSGLFYQSRRRIAELALARRLPICVWSKETFESGALMSYGADQLLLVREAAVYVDRILKGAKPAELPVQEPTRLQLLVNMKVAQALGLSVPTSILLRADEVIE